tara:strand:- start:1256 stop:2047 length:792 start_codon:yes stop_codon:yes gene_type:complete
MSEEQPKKRGRKPKKKPYFGREQEEAVVNYMSLGSVFEDPNTLDENGKPLLRWTGTTQDEFLRNKIYREELKAPLNKMIESIIRTYKLYSKKMEFDDLHTDTLSFLMLKFYKFKPSKGKKSYSYYGTVCKHYLLGKIMKEDKRMKSVLSYEDMSTKLEQDEKLSYNLDDDSQELTKFIKTVSGSIKRELSERILTENEIRVGNSLVYILDNWENLFDSGDKGKKYNKNLILLYMREMTSLSTKDIRNAMRRYKIIYRVLKDDL